MAYAALAFAVLAFLIALIARSTASGLRRAIEDGRMDARRRAENLQEKTGEEIEGLRRTLSRLAAGEKLTPEMVLEGRLWHEASPDEGQRMVAEGGARILDVRTPQETGRGVIPGAILMPVQEIESRWQELPRDGRKMLVYCAGGERSSAACEFLSRQGYESLYNLAGGFLSWRGPTSTPA